MCVCVCVCVCACECVCVCWFPTVIRNKFQNKDAFKYSI